MVSFRRIFGFKLSEILKILKILNVFFRVWSQWREVTGTKMRGLYRQYIDRLNEAAKLNGMDISIILYVNVYYLPLQLHQTRMITAKFGKNPTKTISWRKMSTKCGKMSSHCTRNYTHMFVVS